MNIYQFMGEHWFITIALAFIALEAFCYPFKIVNRWIRHRNIVARGWPPPHLDADGDLKKEES